ncbi:MAG TPA: hypothetical protein PLQ44_03675 [Candidatus Paceibacterota bacterium]|nr:hypothetical protein [Bacteroidales bacterium]HPT40668.1 hypothetical protein [Candidatus Paceibacterota bacterium]
MSENQNKKATAESGNDSHYVLIADETGIAVTFDRLKKTLAEHSFGCITLVYAFLNDVPHPLYKAELQSLEKRFSNSLEVFIISHEAKASVMKAKIQKSIEVIINSNINTVMQFYAGGNAEMVEQVKKLLCFLGIKETQIITEYLN